ncbi:MAG: trehalose-6-phosphate synthase [Bacteroidales bacterium]|nr:trehalose-6-phosphate synthase [Bacteroidales bacterium]
MRLNLALILSIIIAVGIVAFGFTYYQITVERSKLNSELETRVAEVAGELSEYDVFYICSSKYDIESFTDSIKHRYNLSGIAIYFSKDSIVCSSSTRRFVKYSLDDISMSVINKKNVSSFININQESIYQFIKPIGEDNISHYAVIYYVDAGYIDNIISKIWFRNFLRWFMQVLIISIITTMIIRFGVLNPMNKTINWLKAARAGDVDILKRQPHTKLLLPLQKEVIHVAKAMFEAKSKAQEEARVRAGTNAIWTPGRLKEEMKALLQNKQLIVVSNREPYIHVREGNQINCITPASGLITAMEPILKACGGLWIASGTGDADKETVDDRDKIQVPPDDPKYTLKRIWLSKEEEVHFYYGFSNEGIYPLCLIAHIRPIFRIEDWHYYKKINERFAKAIAEETKDEEAPFILIQDYHFALLPEMIRKLKPEAKIAIFWHIPWPNPESFGICPWKSEILKGMLGADLIGFHTQYHCNYFLETVNNALESRVQWANYSVKRAGHSTVVKPFPIGIDISSKDLELTEQKIQPSKLLEKYGITAQYTGIGVDRIDYTKGIPEKFQAIERFFEKNPSYIGKFTFVQIGAPSRTYLKSYSDMIDIVEREAARINLRFKHQNWKAILLLTRHHTHEEIKPFYSSSDFCMVSSLHDGMNLVAKEFIASRVTNDGALILSRFAGAVHELKGAIIVNPYDIEEMAEAIKAALEMSSKDQHVRMEQMREEILKHNVFWWAASLLRAMRNI